MTGNAPITEGLDWVGVVQRLRTIAGEGLAYSENPYDRDRYRRLAELADEVITVETGSLSRNGEAVLIEEGCPTPKVDVRAAVFSENQILLVREASDGRWSLPGGWADLGQTPGEVTVREVAEETGYLVSPMRLLAVWDKARHDHPRSLQAIYKIVTECLLVGPEQVHLPSHEVLEVGWFDPTHPPPLSTGRITQSQVLRIVQLHDDQSLPADFD